MTGIPKIIAGGADRARLWLISKWPATKRGGAIIVMVALIGIVVFSVLVNTFDPTGLGLVDEKDRAFWSKFGPISALLLITLRSLWAIAKSDGSLKHIVVSEYDQTDVKQMAKYMSDADSVIIYSGDFSYIYEYDPLYEALDNLSHRENLILISYKSEETVKTQSESSKGSKNCIIEKLISTNSVYFDVKGKAKFSLVFKKGEEVLLYRHREENTDYVTVFKANNVQTKKLVETVKTLVDVIISDRTSA